MFLIKNFLDDSIFNFLEDDFLFNSSVKDMSPTVYYKKDSDFIIEAKTLGIAPEDIKVEINNDVLSVIGETKNEYSDKSFNVRIKIKIGKETLRGIEKIDYTTKNGVTYIILKMKNQSESAIEINKI